MLPRMSRQSDVYSTGQPPTLAGTVPRRRSARCHSVHLLHQPQAESVTSLDSTQRLGLGHGQAGAAGQQARAVQRHRRHGPGPDREARVGTVCQHEAAPADLELGPGLPGRP